MSLLIQKDSSRQPDAPQQHAGGADEIHRFSVAPLPPSAPRNFTARSPAINDGASSLLQRWIEQEEAAQGGFPARSIAVITDRRGTRPAIALIAHDGRKPDIVAFAMYNRQTLMGCRLLATASTGSLLERKVGLKVERVLAGVEGGDLQVAARVAQGEVNGVIFLVDPFNRHPHEPDIQGLQRVCQVHDVPLATNLSTANLIISALGIEAERAVG